MSLLEVEEVTVSFGGAKALDSVDLTVEESSVTGLIGPNGAGKTTLFNVVCGLLTPAAGRVRLDGSELGSLAPHRRTEAGLARTFQRLELFTSLTVLQNVKVAGDIARKSWSRSDTTGEAREVLELVGLSHLADEDVAAIPTGQARIVELARALMTRPRLLLLDEPASGQNEHETEEFGELLERLRASGLAILLVEHDMSLVMSACDTIWVLDLGAVIAGGTPEEIRRDERVLSAYLGDQQ